LSSEVQQTHIFKYNVVTGKDITARPSTDVPATDVKNTRTPEGFAILQLSGAAMLNYLKVGSRVVRGADWVWGNQVLLKAALSTIVTSKNLQNNFFTKKYFCILFERLLFFLLWRKYIIRKFS